MEDAIPLPQSSTGRSAEDVIRETALLAQGIIKRGFGKTKEATAKGRGNVVTETDFAVEEAVSALLRAEYPSHGILGEEHGRHVSGGAWTWVIDPVDGTKNFSRGIPHFAYTVALYHGDDAQLGLTLQPLLDDWYVARRGAGATLNGQPIHVSESPTVFESVVGMDLGYEDERAALQLELARAIWPNVQSLRVPGSAALGFAYAASGQFDLYVHADLKPWDVAAGLLLVAEAGGCVTDRDGNPTTLWEAGTIAGAPGAHRDFLERYAQLPWR